MTTPIPESPEASEYQNGLANQAAQQRPTEGNHGAQHGKL